MTITKGKISTTTKEDARCTKDTALKDLKNNMLFLSRYSSVEILMEQNVYCEHLFIPWNNTTQSSESTRPTRMETCKHIINIRQLRALMIYLSQMPNSQFTPGHTYQLAPERHDEALSQVGIGTVNSGHTSQLALETRWYPKKGSVSLALAQLVEQFSFWSSLSWRRSSTNQCVVGTHTDANQRPSDGHTHPHPTQH